MLTHYEHLAILVLSQGNPDVKYRFLETSDNPTDIRTPLSEASISATKDQTTKDGLKQYNYQWDKYQ